jgi:hypothetical protein
MKAKDVNPSNFIVEHIVFENEDFSVVIGLWEGESRCMAMRWNGENNDPGYPKLFNNPVWFIVEKSLALPFLNSLRYVANSDKKEIEKAIQKF